VLYARILHFDLKPLTHPAANDGFARSFDGGNFRAKPAEAPIEFVWRFDSALKPITTSKLPAEKACQRFNRPVGSTACQRRSIFQWQAEQAILEPSMTAAQRRNDLLFATCNAPAPSVSPFAISDPAEATGNQHGRQAGVATLSKLYAFWRQTPRVRKAFSR
jgi:hypothetical protein